MNFCRYMHVNPTCFGPSARAFRESNKKENLKQVAWKCVSLLVRMAASSAMTCWCKGWWGMGGECEQNFSLSIPNQAPTTRYYLQGLSSHSVGGWRQFLCDKGHDCPGKCGAWLHSVMPHKSKFWAECRLSLFYKRMTNSPNLVLCAIRRSLEMCL